MTVLSHEQIQKLIGLKQLAAMRRHLRRAGIPFKEVNGRILATEEAFGPRGGREKKKTEPNWSAGHASD